jgi:hypothetical protein
MQQSPNLEGTLNGNSMSASRSGSRMGSMAPDFGGDAHSMNPMFPAHLQRNTPFEAPVRPHSAMPVLNPQPTALFMPQPVSHAPSQLQQETDIDDSGIGMGLMDDDLTMAKFNVGQHIGGDTMSLPAGMRVNAL